MPFFGGLELHSRFYQKTRSSFVGLQQSGTNSVALPPGSAVGDMALFYGVENTSSTASGIQGIAAGPAGWTALSGAGVAQFSTTPTFSTRGIWWKKLVQADITAGVVSFTIGSLGITAACGVLVFRGGSTFALVSSGGVSGTSINQALPADPVTEILMVNLLCLRADLAEVITQPTGYTNLYPGAMFAGAFFFCGPATYTPLAGTVAHWSWTTTSGGFNHNIKLT